jgi:hypothetical protein
MVASGVLRETMRLEEDCTYTSKSHFEAERIWTFRHHLIGVPSAVLAGIAGVAAFNGAAPVFAGTLAVVAGALSALATFLNPSAKAADHHAVGSQYLTVRNQARFLRETSAEDGTALRTKLAALADRRNELNESAPPLPRKAFMSARKGIGEGESHYDLNVAIDE